MRQRPRAPQAGHSRRELPLRIRAAVPFSCHVTGPTADALSPVFDFRSRGCQVTASFRGDDPIELTQPGDEDPWFRRVHLLGIEIDELETDIVTRVVRTNEAAPIVGGVLKLANRVIRSIRNFGLVTHVREYRAGDFTADHWLNLFGVETSTDGVTWTRLREPPKDLAELLTGQSLLRQEHVGHFHSRDLAEVREAIEDDLAAGPERVFLANALEGLRIGDLRAAVVESVICLEMRFLTQMCAPFSPSRSAAPWEEGADALVPANQR